LVTLQDFEGSEWVFSVPGSKIRAKNIKINYGNPQNVLRKPLTNQLFFGLTFEPEMLETKSRALKTRILA